MAPAENAGNQQPGNSGVVLRWRTSARVGSQPTATSAPNAAAVGAPSTHASLAAQAYEANVARQPATRNGLSAPSQPVNSQVVTASAASHSPSGNPLRSSVAANNARQVNAPAPTFVPRGTSSGQRGAVQPANFQAPVGGAPQPPAGGGLLDGTVAPPNFPGANNAPAIQPPDIQAPQAPGAPGAFPPIVPPQDALNVPEDAPAPPVGPPPANDEFRLTPERDAPPAQDSNPAEPMPNGDNELRGLPKDDDPTSPFKNRGQDDLVSPSDRESARRSQELEKKSLPDSSANCEAFRDKLRKSSITQINLNAAPRYGQGMNDDPEKAEKLRLDFAASSEVRQWCDRHGRTVVEGRMIDLVNEQVVSGYQWGPPRDSATRFVRFRLGLRGQSLAPAGHVRSGYDQVAGRSFVPSAIQWKASGLCHKPLYFEEVQLERYGHEIVRLPATVGQHGSLLWQHRHSALQDGYPSAS